MSEPNPAQDRIEPRGMTLMDLAALIVGVAVAISLERTSGFTLSRAIAGTAWEPIFRGLQIGQEVLQKSSVALLPVIAARRVRYAGPVRPAEFLCVCVASPLLVVAIPRLLFLHVPDPGSPRGYNYPPGVIKDYFGIVFLVGLLAAALIPLARRLRPAWIVGVLLCLAWIGLERGGMSRLVLIVNPLLAPPGSAGTIGSYAARQAIFGLSRDVLLFIPAIAAMATIGRPRRIWSEWFGLACALLWWVSSELITLIATYRTSLTTLSPRPFAVTEGIHFGFILLAAVLSLALVRSLCPAWNRWIGVGYDGADTASLRPEA